MKKALIILHQKRSITGDIGKKLKERGYVLDIIRPCCEEPLPENLDNHALVVILGGPISVNDDCEYKDYEITWLKVVVESGKPFLGICLGAQMLAKYLGCKIEKNENKFAEIGFFPIESTEFGYKLFKDQKTFYQFHDEGFELPNESKLLATGKRFKHQAFQYKNCYAFQFHPEVNLYLHLRWLFFVLLYKPRKFFIPGSQNILYQLYLRFNHNKSVSVWLDHFLDNFLLKNY
jgi:GMP synthase (glutamine-hydrolysing)